MEDEEITLRTLKEYDDFEEIMRQEVETLELAEKDIFPSKLMMVASETGGAVVGAFDRRGKLVGFVFNFPGFRYGRIIEWSYLISVLPAQRGRGLERRLKLWQREAALERGVSLICWAFDPLDPRAARRNLNGLGAVCDEYMVDFPDPMSGPVYGKNASDRLVARWHLEDERVISRLKDPAADVEIPTESRVIEVADDSGDFFLRRPPALDLTGDLVALPIPSEISSLRRENIEIFTKWQDAVGKVLTHYFSNGYTAEDFVLTPKGNPLWGWYILRRRVI